MVITLTYISTAYFAFMKNTTAFIITMSVLAILAIVMTLVLKKHRFFTFNIAALSAFTGFNIGTLLYVLTYQATGWESLAAAIAFALIFTTAGAVLGFIKRGYSTLYLTGMLGLLGSCLSTRGLSLLCGGYPIDPVTWALLENGMPIIDIEPIIWLYPFLIIIFSLIFMCWLGTYRRDHCDVEFILYLD